MEASGPPSAPDGYRRTDSAVIGFLNLAALERVRRLRRDSFVIALVTMAAVLTLGVLQA